MLRKVAPILLLTLLALTLGCEGTVSMLQVDPETGDTRPVSASEEEESEAPPAFQLTNDAVQLLPFHVRLNKLSRVAAVPQDDPIFDQVRTSRYDLGDHNYAQGIGANLQWNASKMALWVETLRPVCQSDEMRERYPFLPEHLNELLTTAYGREATQEDLAAYEDVLANADLEESERYEAVCLAVLTSTEFVAR